MNGAGGAGRAYVVLVNYEGWADTLECLESVFRSDYPDFRVIVCDNASRDGSAERIREWAQGRLSAPVPEGALRRLASPPVAKPVPLELVTAHENRGFAAGNNLALRALLARGDFEYAWLLNNDTVVERSALSALVARLRAKPGAGMCGSMIRYYADPARVQTLGGDTYSRWRGTPRHIGAGGESPSPADVEARMAFVMGASMLVSRAFLADVGLMSEDYFLFFEELDWATRARGRYTVAYAPESVVYHKGGQSTGLGEARYNAVADYYYTRAQVLYARRHTPVSLPAIALRHALGLAKGLVTGAPGRARLLGRIYGELARGDYAPGAARARGEGG